MKKVLFVCVENSCRSQMAEAFAIMHGRGLWEAYSAGSKASGIVNKKAILSMKAAGYDMGTHKSKSLEAIPVLEYDYAITMGCGDACPFVRARQRHDWAIPDPKGMDAEKFNEVRNLIEKRVLSLIDEITTS